MREVTLELRLLDSRCNQVSRVESKSIINKGHSGLMSPAGTKNIVNRDTTIKNQFS